MKKVIIKTENNEYEILIARNLFTQVENPLSQIAQQNICIVSSPEIMKLHGKILREALLDKNIIEVEIPAGEIYKNINSYKKIMDALLAAKFNRDCLIIAFGGGVIGDIAGFAASTYQRGVDLLQIPTTLLAQVDSSVGGKNGVNHELGKNMIGTFYQPEKVLIDTAILDTLPARELAAGWAEIIKYALINDLELLHILEQGSASLEEIIARCCKNKADIVSRDEREQGERALLNLGHTFAHALENLGNYEYFNHGEAVALGLLCAAVYSQRSGNISSAEVVRIKKILQKYHLPVQIPDKFSASDIYKLMLGDKKVKAGKLRLITLSAFCQAEINSNPEEALILEAINAVKRGI